MGGDDVRKANKIQYSSPISWLSDGKTALLVTSSKVLL
jgi:hypothetical protein